MCLVRTQKRMTSWITLFENYLLFLKFINSCFPPLDMNFEFSVTHIMNMHTKDVALYIVHIMWWLFWEYKPYHLSDSIMKLPIIIPSSSTSSSSSSSAVLVDHDVRGTPLSAVLVDDGVRAHHWVLCYWIMRLGAHHWVLCYWIMRLGAHHWVVQC